MRTHIHAKETDGLGRYYTQAFISELLIKAVPQRAPTSIIDLGSGEGSLSLAAYDRWKKFDLFTVDIDADVGPAIKRKILDVGFNGRHIHIDQDALDVSLKNRIIEAHGRMPAVAICNPPFQVLQWREGYGELLRAAGFSDAAPAITTTDTALLFLAQNLHCLPDNGTLGIIVPDSLVAAEKYAGFRKELLKRYSLLKAIRLPHGSFRGTHAVAHILIITKRTAEKRHVILSELISHRGETVSIIVPYDSLGDRIDYRYQTSESQRHQGVRLVDVAESMHRGALSSADIKASGALIYHTRDIRSTDHGCWLDFSGWSKDAKRFAKKTVVARAGDILVARVGRNMSQKIVGVHAGQVALSDCLFRVRVAPELRELVMHELCSPAGKSWLDAHAYGVAVSHLTKIQLQRFPLTGLSMLASASAPA